MCPLDNNISSLSNQDLTATAILIANNESDIIDQTKKILSN